MPFSKMRRLSAYKYSYARYLFSRGKNLQHALMRQYDLLRTAWKVFIRYPNPSMDVERDQGTS